MTDLDSQLKWYFDGFGIKLLQEGVRVAAVIVHHLAFDNTLSECIEVRLACATSIKGFLPCSLVELIRKQTVK